MIALIRVIAPRIARNLRAVVAFIIAASFMAPLLLPACAGSWDTRSPGVPIDGLHVAYREEYRTGGYYCWQQMDGHMVAHETVVIRRGTTVVFSGPSDATLSVEPVKSGMDALSASAGPPWSVTVPAGCTVGAYRVTATNTTWTGSMEMHVIFDPWASGIDTEKLRAYSYDEGGGNAWRDAIFPTRNLPVVSVLHSFDPGFGTDPSMLELAMALVGNVSTDMDAMLRVHRLSAQRNEANLDRQTGQIYRNVSEVLFFSDENTEPVTLTDALVIGMNGVSINSLASPGKVKTINGWCMEATLVNVALARALGIPARSVSLYSREGLMGHYIPEVWIAEPPLMGNAASEILDQDQWYIFDSDEWRYPVNFGAPVYPVLYAPSGNIVCPRGMYNKAFALLTHGLYNVRDLICVGTDFDLDRPVSLKEHYSTELEYSLVPGKVSAPISHGSGLLFHIDVTGSTRVTISGGGDINPVMFVSNGSYPAHDLLFTGFPYTLDENYTGRTVVLDRPGRYYISIYSHTHYSGITKGDYGWVQITVERSAPTGAIMAGLALIALAAVGLFLLARRRRPGRDS